MYYKNSNADTNLRVLTRFGRIKAMMSENHENHQNYSFLPNKTNQTPPLSHIHNYH